MSSPLKVITLEPKNSTQWERFKLFLESIGENGVFTGAMSVITIWTLFQADIRLAGTSKDADTGFLVLVSIIFFLFIFEITIQSIYKKDYCKLPNFTPDPDETFSQSIWRRIQFGSFYFWLDWIATLTLVFELNWLIGQDAANTISGSNSQSAKAGSASRAGARAGRVVRLVRMVRLVRLIKLYKYATAKKEEEGNDEDMPEESRVGAAMADLTNRRVIILVLMMLIIIPLLTVSDADVSLSLAVQMINSLGYLNSTDPTTYSSGLDLAINTVLVKLPVLQIILGDNVIYYDSKYEDLRTSERVAYELTTNNFYTSITYDQKDVSVNGSLYSIYTTLFIMGLLVGGTFFFSSDVNRLVIGPIERLVDLVRKISANPLGVEYKTLGAKEGFIEGMETTILLTTIMKIGALMRVGFGEAGASIIAKNLAESTSGKLNLLGSGTMINSIFGFCDVRQFTDTTECLQEEVMLFVNRIAHILHSIVVQCSGAANKNIGDAFLLTWKVDDKLSPEQVSSLADQALLTFCKALIELSRHQEFICNFSLAATARLFKRFKDYSVRIGSGLHYGWAIEGAIGSNKKIDASYLSPNVSATEFLESSTKAYGVALLISEPFYKLLSPAATKYIRQVDRVRRSDAEDPMSIYTYDSDLNINWNDPYRNKKKDGKTRLQVAAKNVINKKARSDAGSKDNSSDNMKSTESLARHGRKKSKDHLHSQHAGRRRSVADMPGVIKQPITEIDEQDPEAAEKEEEEANRERMKQAPTILVPPYTQQVWDEDQDLVELRHRFTDNMRTAWEPGINAYVRGDWQKAKEVFEEILTMSHNKDGPSKFLLEMIAEHGGVAPDNWKGYRDEGGGH